MKDKFAEFDDEAIETSSSGEYVDDQRNKKKIEERDQVMENEKKDIPRLDKDAIKKGMKKGSVASLKVIGKAAVATTVVATGTYVGMRAYDKWARKQDEIDVDNVDNVADIDSVM